MNYLIIEKILANHSANDLSSTFIKVISKNKRLGNLQTIISRFISINAENIEILSPKNQLHLFGYENYFSSFIKLFQKNKLPLKTAFSMRKNVKICSTTPSSESGFAFSLKMKKQIFYVFKSFMRLKKFLI